MRKEQSFKMVNSDRFCRNHKTDSSGCVWAESCEFGEMARYGSQHHGRQWRGSDKMRHNLHLREAAFAKHLCAAS